jgi:hypothetical protein
MMKFDTFVVTFFHLYVSVELFAGEGEHSRIVLNDMTVWVLWASIGVL